MNPPTRLFIYLFLLLISGHLVASPGDADNDGLRDEVETNTGIYVSPSNTGTNPNLADTDGDSLPDGMEVNLETNPVDASSKVKRPNIIFIMADDLGYGDVGCFWQNQKTGQFPQYKFATPQLDRMAADGAMMTHHYSGVSICAGARASFLQGLSQGHADVRGGQFDSPLPDTRSIPNILKNVGYRTVHIGKAGLAGPDANSPTAHPLDRGFDRFFGYLLHVYAHEHYPRNGLGKNGSKISNDRSFIMDGYQDLFSADAFTAFAKKEIIEQTMQRPDQPFFIYLAYDTPHFDLQFPPTANYPTGRGVTGGLQWTGTPSYVNTATNDPAKVNNVLNAHPSCSTAWFSQAKAHVSMIRRIDDSMEDLLQTLRDLNIADNTLVVFTSDNGPAPEGMNPPTFQSYGGFEGVKQDLLEGGIRMPTIVWWPGKIPATGSLTNIRKIDRPSANYDWLATFSEMAGAVPPVFTSGVSILPTLTQQGVQQDKGFLYFELYSSQGTTPYPDFVNNGSRIRGDMQAIRKGPFMGLRTGILTGSEDFTIYDIANDPKQSTNLAGSMPALNSEMKRLSIGARRKGVGINRTYETAQIPAFQPTIQVKPGLKWSSYEGYWPLLPDFKFLTPAASGDTININPSLRSRDKDVGLLFEGYISIATAGSYTFQVSSSSESSLWIHEAHVIDNDYRYLPTKTSAAVNLKSGIHPIRLYYRHRQGTATLDLKYSGPGIALQTVPTASFFSDGPTPVFSLQPDKVSTKANTAVLVDSLANDTCNYPLTLASAGPAASGTASISAGKILFTPPSESWGKFTFPYSVSGGGGSATSTVTANVLFDNETWIPFDEASGTSAEWVSPTANNTGSLTRNPSLAQLWAAGKSGNCLGFDGISDQVSFTGLTLPSGNLPRTFCCWLKTGASVSDEIQTLFSYGSQTSGGLFAVQLNNTPGVSGNFPVRLDVSGGSVIGTKPLNDGQWHYLVVMLSDVNQDTVINVFETKIFIDGELDPISSVIPQIINTGNDLVPCVGGSNQATNYNYTGQIDELRVFPRMLSDLEISNISPRVVPVFSLLSDKVVTKRNTSVLIDSLANDTGNYPLTLASVGPSGSGTASISAGKILYTPANDFIGKVLFPYSVSGGGDLAPSTITANVLFDNETWIPFDEESGTSAEWVSPTANNTGTLTRNPRQDHLWAAGKYGNCLGFDGISDQVNFTGLSLPSGNYPRTFCCWLKTSATVSNEIQTLFSYGSQTSGGMFAVQLNNTPGVSGNFPARLDVFGGSVIGTKPLNDGQWHYLVVMLSDVNNDTVTNVSEAKIFVDGVLDPISSVIPQIINTGNDLVPCAGGSNQATNYNYTGQIDDVRVFPRVLSDLEIGKLNPAIVIPPDNTDSDGDGISDYLESIAGTNPNDKNSLFKIINASKSVSAMTLSWSGIAGRTYRIEQSSNLTNWSLVPGVAPVVVTASSPILSVTVPDNGISKRFLRMQVTVTP